MIGRVVKGKYKIYDEVGSGGFATVYLGRNVDTNEIVAVKVLSKQYTREGQYVERFHREASLAERLQHPNIVRVLDHGIEDGIHFLVMEFVEGLTLDKLMQRKGRLPIEEALSYAEQACAGLQAAYKAGVVHRDVKPANLMITPSGAVKIMDFGIARMESMASLTQSGMFMGTPRYISPEMAKGAKADIRADLYSLGLLMYEMLTGMPPFDAENPWAVLRQQIEGDPTPIRTLRPDIPTWLEAIVNRALAKDPIRRFQTPAEMLAALKGHLATPSKVHDTPAPVVPPLVPTIVRKAQPRSGMPRRLVYGIGGVVVLIAVGLAAVFFLGGGAGKATPVPTTLVAVAPGSTASPVVIVVTDAPRDTATPTVAEPTATLRPTSVPPTDTPPPEPTDTANPPTEAAPPTELPTVTILPTDTPAPATNTPKPKAANTPAPTAAPTSLPTVAAPAVSGRIAFSAGETLYTVDAATKQTLFTVPRMHQPDVRLDGAEILADGMGSPATLVNINARTGSIVREQTSFTDDFHPFWSPDGSRFAYDSLHHGLPNVGTMLYTQGLTDRKPQQEVTLGYSGQQIRGHSPVWTQNDMIVFTGCDYWPDGSGGSRCGLYMIPSWGESRPSLIHPGSTDMRATDNYGSQLLLMSQESGNWEVFLMPLQGGQARNLSNGPNSNDGLGTFSPDGRLVAFASNRQGGWAVWVVKLDGSGLTKLFNMPGPPTQPWYEDSMSWGP
jgi:tRNA A-37 threonylcarbamoyl transferase component Bud32